MLICSTWLGIFAYKHVDYSNELWWQFALHSDAPRFLRAAVGAMALLLAFAAARLLRTASRDPGQTGPEELEKARRIIGRSPTASANLSYNFV